MHAVLDIKTIEKEIMPYLPTAKRGFVTQTTIPEVINAILYKLKSGTQWRLLPVESLFSETILSWKGWNYLAFAVTLLKKVKTEKFKQV